MKHFNPVYIKTAIALMTISVMAPIAAHAQVREVRVGVTNFDTETFAVGWAAASGRENSIGINANVTFASPNILKPIGSPRPYIGGMVNLNGDTSYVGAGFAWRAHFSEKFYADAAIGGVIHNGTLAVFTRENLNESGFKGLLERDAQEISFGSRALFRPELALGYRITDEWATELFYEHLSNANFADINEGADSIGMRVARKF